MRKLFFETRELGRILKNMPNLKRLEKKLKAKIEIPKQKEREGRRELIISARETFQELVISNIIEAISLGFGFSAASQLQSTDYEFVKLNIKNFVKAQNQARAKARLIGPQGKTKRTIEELSNCDIAISNHTVAIIGRSDNVETASQAIKSLLRGSKQANIFNFLERNRARLRGLEEENVTELIEMPRKDKDN